MADWLGEALNLAQQPLPFEDGETIRQNLGYITDDPAEAYRIGAEEAQNEIVGRLRASGEGVETLRQAAEEVFMSCRSISPDVVERVAAPLSAIEALADALVGLGLEEMRAKLQTRLGTRCLKCGQVYGEWRDRCEVCGGPVSTRAGTIHVGGTER